MTDNFEDLQKPDSASESRTATIEFRTADWSQISKDMAPLPSMTPNLPNLELFDPSAGAPQANPQGRTPEQPIDAARLDIPNDHSRNPERTEYVLSGDRAPMSPNTSDRGVLAAYNGLLRDLNLNNIANLTQASKDLFENRRNGILGALFSGDPSRLQTTLSNINTELTNQTPEQRANSMTALNEAITRFNGALNSERGDFAVNTGLQMSLNTNLNGDLVGVSLGFDAAIAAPHIRTRIPHHGSVQIPTDGNPTTSVSGWGNLDPRQGFSATAAEVLGRMRERLPARGLSEWLRDNPLP